MSHCTCYVQPSTSKFTSDNICEFCSVNLWASLVELRSRRMSEDLEATKDGLEGEIERLLNVIEGRFVSEQDVERMIDEALRGDESMTAQEVESEIEEALDKFAEGDGLQSAITSVLEDTDLVKNVAAGAAAGAMEEVNRYRQEQDKRFRMLEAFAASNVAEMDRNLVAAMERLVTLERVHDGGFWSRLRWLVTGK